MHAERWFLRTMRHHLRCDAQGGRQQCTDRDHARKRQKRRAKKGLVLPTAMQAMGEVEQVAVLSPNAELAWLDTRLASLRR